MNKEHAVALLKSERELHAIIDSYFYGTAVADEMFEAMRNFEIVADALGVPMDNTTNASQKELERGVHDDGTQIYCRDDLLDDFMRPESEISSEQLYNIRRVSPHDT